MLVLNGPRTVGKSTLLGELADRLGQRVVDRGMGHSRALGQALGRMTRRARHRTARGSGQPGIRAIARVIS